VSRARRGVGASFICEGCGQVLPRSADMGADGDFHADPCPSCYGEVLYLGGLLPNEAQAKRMQEC
jgi:hypothetical protein